MIINSFDAAISLLEKQLDSLRKSQEKTEWLRYVFRRIPLFSGAGLVFYLICFAMTFVDGIGFKGVNQFLIAPIVIPYNWASLALLLCSFLMWDLYRKEREKASERSDGDGRLSHTQKNGTKFLLFMLLISGVSLVCKSEFPLVLGLAVFSVVTFFAMLTDRTLGFTRGNERSRLFATRAESLQVMLRSRQALGEIFEKSHLDELYKFFDELRLMKYNDTVADTQYLMTQLEKLKEKK